MSNATNPSESAPQEPPSARGIGKLDPAELLARALHTAQPSGGATAWTPPAPEELARLLPQYAIESLIGQGGMGAVYKGRQPALDRPVAIKLLPAEVAANEQFIARFRREARTLAKLQYSGIVAVHDFGQTGEGHLYFVMEYVDGTDLRQILSGPGLNPAQALELISQVCDALHYAHGRDVIHRDIKPGNILVTAEGRAKLADFGLARPIKDQTSQLTGSNAVMGTADYMAPEQRTGHADQRADIYALGVMLYEMLTGKRPYGVFDPPSHRVVVDIRLDEVVLKAMQQETERRYQQVSEMKTDVDTIRATPLPGPKQKEVTKPPHRHRLSLTAFIAAVCALSAGIFILEKSGRTKLENDPTAAELRAATKEHPFVNSLGMKFVSVPITGGPSSGQQVLFSVWETRVKDYEPFVQETHRDWRRPFFEQGPTHPAVFVSWDDAQEFCAWLTQRERKTGQLGVTERYRLPTDHEWSCAVGIGNQEDPAQLPADKARKLPGVFPWGGSWPPPPDADNYGGAEIEGHKTFSNEVIRTEFRDAFPYTAPVGSFAASDSGLFDLGGNVREWCEDFATAKKERRVMRGMAFHSADPIEHLSSRRNWDTPASRTDGLGFRVVLAPIPVALRLRRETLTGTRCQRQRKAARFQPPTQTQRS